MYGMYGNSFEEAYYPCSITDRRVSPKRDYVLQLRMAIFPTRIGETAWASRTPVRKTTSTARARWPSYK
jgi:hypothetical protein